jgi:hypothetical protein
MLELCSFVWHLVAAAYSICSSYQLDHRRIVGLLGYFTELEIVFSDQSFADLAHRPTFGLGHYSFVVHWPGS